MTNALELRDISRDFGGVRALDDVSFDVPAGGRHVIFGPNGAGKTTLFKVLSGEIAATHGSVTMLGRDITRSPAWRRARSGLSRTFQVTTLFPDLTVRQHLLLACQASDRRRFLPHRRAASRDQAYRRAEQRLDAEGLTALADQPVSTLSYGDQRLVELAVALANTPRVLLLDEPIAGLAHEEIPRVIDRIAALPTETTIVLIEHNLEVAFGVSHTATALAEGMVIADGTVDDVRNDPRVQETYLGAVEDAASYRE